MCWFSTWVALSNIVLLTASRNKCEITNCMADLYTELPSNVCCTGEDSVGGHWPHKWHILAYKNHNLIHLFNSCFFKYREKQGWLCYISGSCSEIEMKHISPLTLWCVIFKLLIWNTSFGSKLQACANQKQSIYPLRFSPSAWTLFL